jgi:hypothetical protein
MVFILNFSGAAFIKAQDQNTEEKYSAIVEAEGTIFLSEDKTIRRIREEALAEARRAALEKGRTYIRSVTRVENFQLSYDLVQSESEGFVKVLESKDLGVTSDNRYRYWIKAEIEYRMKTPGRETGEWAVPDASAPLRVSVRTDRESYKNGEKVRIFIKGNKDFYARVLFQDAEGNTLQLVPNQVRKDNFFKSGRTEVIPASHDQFELEVTPPFGKEKIIVYASTAPQGEVKTAPAGSSLLQVRESLEDAGFRTRGVKIVPDSGRSGAEFYETQYEIKTQEEIQEDH